MILTHWHYKPKNFSRLIDANLNDDISFNTEGRGVRGGRGYRGGRGNRGGRGGRGGLGSRPIICYKCNKSGNKSNVCHGLTESGQTNAIISDDDILYEQDGFIFCLRLSDIKSTWIILDNQSTVG